jgi:hypothetical protein
VHTDPGASATVSSGGPSNARRLRTRTDHPPTRRSLLTSAAAVTIAGVFAVPVAASPRADVPAVAIVIDVAESAQGTMPADLWRKLALAALHARSVRAERGTRIPDDAECRAVHAAFAVLAQFSRATRLPGFAQDPDRAYAVARLTIRDCVTGATASKVVRIESDPLTAADRIDPEAAAERVWDRPVRVAFQRDPVALPALAITAAPPLTATPPVAVAARGGAPAAIARVIRIEDGTIVVNGVPFAVTQLLRDYADGAGHPHAPIMLIVTGVDGRLATASVVGDGRPNIGDRVDAAPAAGATPAASTSPTPSPAPRP